ncbi:MAG: efflux RND transporter periplasmic adaptor subunit [SAR86 cluster bacterium]|uniref:Efflux RND transporter periplasmic adaptor subunit n=1 Tax=SAR86 cluster bacterium TaxID=2030880 RepID=A0A937JHS1_9GAMM|nr:efflux RND transporter periplasmic adaptor subunit [SAR86 cluster bacterium]MDC0873493.1 efflux RND transporter periplasmic adaptor subunit [Gammaproteobacteria bacterium]|tara:strand:+ start:3219 stop:4364 length:1146 start_codon:yes stop_codon:yes gene_type:complete
MSDKKDLLNDLKIDRSDNNNSEKSPLLKIITLIVASVFILAVTKFIFLSEGELLEVSAYKAKPAGQSNNSSASVLDASGYVTARMQATVSSKITGKVLEVFIEEGMFVEKGQILAQLDDSSVQAELNFAKTQLKEAQRVFNRTSELRKDNLASQASLDAAESQVDGLKARLDISKQIVADMQIRAPFSGVVINKAAQPGEMISPVSAGGGFTRTGIGTIVDMNSLEVEVDVNESYINRVKPGQPAITNLNAYPNWDISSEVIAIIPTADRNKATVKVRIGLLEKDARVLPDMGAKVSFLKDQIIEAPEKLEGVMIPSSSLIKEGNLSYVFVIKNGLITKTKVTVGSLSSNFSRISNGIEVGDNVVTDPSNELQNGQEVLIK